MAAVGDSLEYMRMSALLRMMHVKIYSFVRSDL